MRRFFCLVFLFSALVGFAQDKKVTDSLTNLLKRELPDTQRASVYSALAGQYTYHDPDLLKTYALKAIETARASGNQKALAGGYLSYGIAMENEARFDAALDYYDSAYFIFKKQGDQQYMARAYLDMGNVYNKKGDLAGAADFVLRSLNIQEKLQDTFGIAVCRLTLGNIYYGQGSKRLALQSYQEAFRLTKAQSDNPGFNASLLGNLGSMYEALGSYDSARIYLRLSLQVFQKADLWSKLGTSYNNIGQTFEDAGQYDSAMYYRRLALTYHFKAQRPDGVASVYLDIGDVFDYMGQPDSALYYYNEALKIFSSIGAKDGRLHAYDDLSSLYEEKKDYVSALHYSRLYTALNDSLHGAEQNLAMETLQRNYDKDKADEKLRLADAQTKAEHERNVRNQVLFGAVSLVGLIIIIVIVLMLLTKNRHNRILGQKNSEIYRQNLEISQQKEEITASINYAKRIQEAILPLQKSIRQALPESFVLWLPRDIVSGDFYWFAERGNKIFIACVDCTGHGVPGAFMSMIGNAFLNEIVLEKNIYAPEQILQALHERVLSALKQQGETNAAGSPGSTIAQVHDGMDIALCVIDKTSRELAYAGANRPLWIVRSGILREISADKQPIGGAMGYHRPFTQKNFQLQRGDCVYMSSDGYPDQFGGDKGKKFMTKRFQELLASLHGMEMEKQKEKLETTFMEWKKGHTQIDDVLVIGIAV